MVLILNEVNNYVNNNVNLGRKYMKLRDYLYFHKITQTHFARCIGISLVALHRILNDLGKPSLIIAMKIHKFTEGIVTYEDFVTNEEVAIETIEPRRKFLRKLKD